MDPHVLSIVSHLILHAIEEFGDEKGLTVNNFDPTNAEHESFAKESANKLVGNVFDEFKRLEALKLQVGSVPVVQGSNTVN